MRLFNFNDKCRNVEFGIEDAFPATNQNLQSPNEQLKMFVAEPPSLPFGKSPFEKFCARSFGSGEAIAGLLSRMNFDWRERSQKGASFESLLAEAARFNPRVTHNFALIPREQHNYIELLAQAKDWKKKFGSDQTVNDFNRWRRMRLTLNVPSTNTQYPNFVGKASGIPSQPAKNTVINSAALLLELNYQKLFFRRKKFRICST